MDNKTLKNLINWKDFQKSPEGEALFPTEASARWFIRVNEQNLIEQGAIVKLRGQWFLVRPEFDQAVISIAAEKARSQLVA